MIYRGMAEYPEQRLRSCIFDRAHISAYIPPPKIRSVPIFAALILYRADPFRVCALPPKQARLGLFLAACLGRCIAGAWPPLGSGLIANTTIIMMIREANRPESFAQLVNRSLAPLVNHSLAPL